MTDVNVDLGDLDGVPFDRAAIRLRKAGDGLSEAMVVAPTLIRKGDTGYALVKWTCSKVVAEDQVQGKGDGLRVLQVRVAILDAGGAALVDAELASDTLDAMADLIREHRDAEAGQAAMLQTPAEEQRAARRRGTRAGHLETVPDPEAAANEA